MGDVVRVKESRECYFLRSHIYSVFEIEKDKMRVNRGFKEKLSIVDRKIKRVVRYITIPGF